VAQVVEVEATQVDLVAQASPVTEWHLTMSQQALHLYIFM
jgi:hypothetical protein